MIISPMRYCQILVYRPALYSGIAEIASNNSATQCILGSFSSTIRGEREATQDDLDDVPSGDR